MLEVRNLDEGAGTSIPAPDRWYSVEASRATVYHRFCKRSVDLMVSTVALIVLLPLLFVISALVHGKLGGKRI